jgi:uncharacterized protein YndB with AHSA1/START domain
MHLPFLLAALLAAGLARPLSTPAVIAPVVHENVIQASVDDVWAAFTTKAGIESWMVPHAEIDLRVGGKMRTTYNKDATLGDDSTIENTILSYDPKRMLSIRATKAPKGFPFVKALEAMWTVIYFEAAGPGRTKVTVKSMGFTEDEQSQQMRKHFDAGNKFTLDKLAERFAKKP